MLRVWLLGIAVVLASPQVHARRGKSNQVTPGKRAKYKPDADLSRGGERKGGIELALGSITAVLSATLVGRGVWELVRAKRAADQCEVIGVKDPTCGRGEEIAGGLSLAFAVPIAVASGFLFRYGVRIRRDHRKFHQQNATPPTAAVSPWFGARSGGLGVAVRF